MTTELTKLSKAWREWASSADQSEDGWQSNFPYWSRLMSAASAAMVDRKVQQECLPEIELCWRISEEGEDMADFAKDHVEDCWPVLVELIDSKSAEVRWQVFSVLPTGGHKAGELLRKGLNDSDSYCRRRALIALAYLHPNDLVDLKMRLMQDSDPYVRRVAEELII